MANKKTFTIEINGVKQAYEDVCLLTNSLNKLETSLAQSRITSSLSTIFSNASNICSLFKTSVDDIEKIIAQSSKLESVVLQIDAIHKQVSPVASIATTADTSTLKKNDTTTTEIKTDKATDASSNETEKQLKKFGEDAKKTLDEVGKEGGNMLIKFKEKLKDNLDADTNIKKEGLDKIKTETVKTAKITKADKSTNVDATRTQLELSRKTLDDYKVKLDEVESKSKSFFSKQLALYKDDSDEKKAIAEVQTEFEKTLSLKRQDIILKEDEIKKTSQEVAYKWAVESLDQIKVKWDEHQSYLTNVSKAIQDFNKASAENYKAQAAKIAESITQIDAKLKESTAKQTELNKEAATATGEKATVIQEQLAREMEANEALTNQKKEQEKEKARLSAEATVREKRQKRAEILSSIPKAIADVAAGVSKALSLGILGIPIGVMIAAQGAFQVATIMKQLDKLRLEDGGLLRGKRHTQGGMRIEGTNIEVEGDEFVVNRISTRKNLGLIDYINRQRKELSPADLNHYFTHKSPQKLHHDNSFQRIYQQGGQLTNLEVISEVTAPDNNKLLDAISRINFRPVVSVVDIINTQNSITQVKDIAGV